MSEELVNQNKKEELDMSKMNEDEWVDEQNEIFNLPLGEALAIEDTYLITSKSKTKLIVLAGPSECGKTTLITTVYQLFHKAPIDEFYFAGSQTIKGFEQRAYHTRTNSGMNTPNTQRTRIGSIDSFLHLKLWNSKKKSKHTFLLADFSGEDFKNARANVEVMKEDFSVIKRADFLVVIIDGDSITQKDKRYSAVQITQELLRTMKNAKVLNDNTKICFVVSKSDIVKIRCKDNPSLSSFVNEIPNKLNSIFNNIENEIQFYNIAAMPKNTEVVSVGYGISELIKEWTKEPIISNDYILVEQKELKSEFNRFYRKVLGGEKDE